MFKGLFTALITPFKNGVVDLEAFSDFIEYQIAEGVHGVVVCGTTGEGPTIEYEEHKELIECAVKTAKKRVAVFAAATSNNTRQAIKLAHNAKSADAILIAPPYYNKPTQAGIYEHYKAIASSVQHPIIVYNIPGRCAVDITNHTMKQILQLPEVVAIKDSTQDLDRVIELKTTGVSLLSGDDCTALAFNAQGGNGCISVTSNIAPQLCVQLQNHCMQGDYISAQKINDKLFQLNQALFCETNPIPIKYAVSLIHPNIDDEMRLPLLKASKQAQQRIKEECFNIGLINN